MPAWQPIETAPKDGRTIRVKREFQGRKIYEGPAAWRTAHFPELAPDPLGRSEPAGLGAAFDATGWMLPRSVAEKRVPEPTHWLP